MRPTTSLILLAGAAASLGFANTARADGEATAAKNPDEIRAIVAEMISDSETRSSLLQSGATAGHDGQHFFVGSADGKFKLEVAGQIQFRYNLNFQNKDNNSGGNAGDGFDSGFQDRLTRLIFQGHIFGPDLFYKVSANFGDDGNQNPIDTPNTGNGGTGGLLQLEDAFVGYNFGNGVKAQWGQFKLPFLREELVDNPYQLDLERSTTNSVFSQGRSQGMQVSYEAESWRVFGAFSDGFNSANTNYTNQPAEWALTARGELLVMGNWKQFEQFTSPQGSDTGLMIGAAASYEQGANGGPGTLTGDAFDWTIDASFDADGFNLYGAFIGNHISDGGVGTDSLTGDGQSADNFGLVLQGGVYLTESVEIFGRWDQIWLTDSYNAGNPDNVDSTSNFKTITGGFNYYIYGQAAKFSADVQWNLDKNPGGVFNITNNNTLGPSDNNEVGIRFQFQLLF